METRSIKTALAAAALFVAQGVGAEGFDQSKAYAGGGFGYNSIGDPWDNAIGWQIFAGYELDQVQVGENIASAVEVGYMSSGSFEYADPFFGVSIDTSAQGLWATYLASYDLNPQWNALGRIGLDFGDDSGLMFGIGGEYKLDEQKQIRLEYVIRDMINSLQGNFVYRF